MARFRHHIFVCENLRPADSPKGCCAAKGSETVRQAIKDEIDRRGWRKVVRASAAKCLDQCALGVTVVVYPEDIWYGGVRLADVSEILDSLREGRVVERLRIPDEKLSGRALAGPLP